MNKLKVKILPKRSGGFLGKTAQGTEEEVNEFLQNNDVEVIDVRVSSNQYGALTVLLLYKEKH